MTNQPAHSPQPNSEPTIPEQSPPTTQPIKPSQSPKPKKWLMPTIIVVVLLLLGSTGYFIYQNYQIKQKALPQTKLDQDLPPSSDVDCIDSDDGFSIHTLGKVTFPKHNNVSFSDECGSDFDSNLSPNVLFESVCNSTDLSSVSDIQHISPLQTNQGDPYPGSMVRIECSGPCSNGICLNDQSTAPTDWKIYSNSNPDYQVKYPSDWNPVHTANPTMGDLEDVTISTATKAFSPTDCSFNISSWDQPMTASIQIAKDQATQTNTVTINNITATKFVYSPNATTVSHTHFLSKDNYHYQISLNQAVNTSNDQCLNRLNQILNSFQFTLITHID